MKKSDIFWVVAVIIMIDVVSYMAWQAMGQTPVDNIYLGTLTAHFLNIF